MSFGNIAILHPGEMGVSIAAAAKSNGREVPRGAAEGTANAGERAVYWASAGRSQATRERAKEAGLVDLGSLDRVCAECDVLLSVCPPAAAEEVARSAAGAGFRGTFVDANAISPGRAERQSEVIENAGGRFVDGSIVGPPAWKPGTTRLYLSGAAALRVAEIFAGSPVEAVAIGEQVGKASALKICFSAYSKGTTALLSAILAAADRLEVSEELFAQWSLRDGQFAAETVDRTRGATKKAWRFVGEMEEIAETMREAGVPGDFHAAAAEVYRRLAPFKSAAELPTLEAVVAALRRD